MTALTKSANLKAKPKSCSSHQLKAADGMVASLHSCKNGWSIARFHKSASALRNFWHVMLLSAEKQN